MTDTDLVANSASETISGLLLPQLRSLAGQLGIKGTSAMRKDALIAAITERQSASSAPRKAAAPAVAASAPSTTPEAVIDSSAPKPVPLLRRSPRHPVLPPPTLRTAHLVSVSVSVAAHPARPGLQRARRKTAPPRRIPHEARVLRQKGNPSLLRARAVIRSPRRLRPKLPSVRVANVGRAMRIATRVTVVIEARAIAARVTAARVTAARATVRPQPGRTR